MNNIIYIRTSKEEGNPENQLASILSMLPEDQRELAVIVTEQQSAFKDDFKVRPKFAALQADIKTRLVKAIYVWDLDRIYRNRLKLKQFLELCKVYKIKVYSFRQQWLNDINNIPDPWNEIIYDLLINILGWMAEDESKKRSDRVKASTRIKKGKTYSYKGNKWGRKSLPKQTINRILEKYKEGFTVRDIAMMIKTTDKNNNQKPISKSAVHKVVQDYNHENLV